jgi:hypothetical protein
MRVREEGSRFHKKGCLNTQKGSPPLDSNINISNCCRSWGQGQQFNILSIVTVEKKASTFKFQHPLSCIHYSLHTSVDRARGVSGSPRPQYSHSVLTCDSLRLVFPHESPQRPSAEARPLSKGVGHGVPRLRLFLPAMLVRSVGCVGARYGVRSVVAATVGEHVLTGTVDGSTLLLDRGSSRLR